MGVKAVSDVSSIYAAHCCCPLTCKIALMEMSNDWSGSICQTNAILSGRHDCVDQLPATMHWSLTYTNVVQDAGQWQCPAPLSR